MPSLQQSHLQSSYRPIAIGFCVLAVLILGIALYSGSSGATISLTAVPQEEKTIVTITIGPKTDGGSLYLTGTVKAESLEETVTAKPSGTGPLVPAHARGTVTFHNTSTKIQPLSAGTRLQQTGGDVIVRTTTRIDVAPGTTVDATVVADPLGESGNLPPGRFVIVALWPGLQDKIYATSDAAFTGGLASEAGGLGLEELTDASNNGEKTLREKFGASQSGTLKQLLPIGVVTVPPASEPSSEYTVTVRMKGLTVTYNADQLLTIVREHLQPLVPDEQSLSTVVEPHLVIENQPTTTEVVVTVTGKGQSKITAASQFLQPSQFVALSRQEILARLGSSESIKDVTVKFSPPWRHTAPAQPEKIRIVIATTK